VDQILLAKNLFGCNEGSISFLSQAIYLLSNVVVVKRPESIPF